MWAQALSYFAGIDDSYDGIRTTGYQEKDLVAGKAFRLNNTTICFKYTVNVHWGCVQREKERKKDRKTKKDIEFSLNCNYGAKVNIHLL